MARAPCRSPIAAAQYATSLPELLRPQRPGQNLVNVNSATRRYAQPMTSDDNSDRFSGPRLELEGKDSIPLIERCTIGRHPNNAICIDHKKISRWHAAIIRLSDRDFRLMDLDTVNGTWLNRRRIKDPAILGNGDQIRIGPVVIMFRNDAESVGITSTGLETTLVESMEPADLENADFEPTGHGIVAVNKHGKVRAMTESARQWIATFFDYSWIDKERLPTPIHQWVTTGLERLERDADAGLGVKPLRRMHGSNRVSIQLKSDRERRETLLLIAHEEPLFKLESLIEEFQSEFGLTNREGEILYYLALGKTNPEIATITDCSARTVEAHLRKVFPKIGVENRQAAAVFVPDHFRGKHRSRAEAGVG